MELELKAPFSRELLSSLRAGDQVFLTGTIYTARDAAHKRFITLLEEDKPLPFPIKDAIIYYAGPSPASPGRVIGSIGPTTSYRMDSYTPALLDAGLLGMIGKGSRSQAVADAIRKSGSVYFAAIGGLGALLASRVQKADVIAFEDLGPEAVRRLEVVRLPLFVALDSVGGNLYTQGREQYLSDKEKRS